MHTHQALILAAGFGKRLMPFTQTKPKCMLSFQGKTLLDWQTEAMAACGITDITVVAGHGAASIPAKYPKIINARYETTNMVYSLFCGHAQWKQQADLIISYGDIVYEEKVLAQLLADEAPISLIFDRQWRTLWSARMNNPLDDVETFVRRPDGTVLSLGQKPRTETEVQGQYIGLIKVRADRLESFVQAYEHLKQTENSQQNRIENLYMTDFIQHLIDTGWLVNGVGIDGGWLEFDTVSDLETYQMLAQNGQLSELMAWDNAYVPTV
ncbi:MAG: phosphocholine cytidylyltransferase family protein [Cyanobacteria bacterium P01_H01_bin.74]